jgi:hypothetical protein
VDIRHHDCRLRRQDRFSVGGEQTEDPDCGDMIAVMDRDLVIIDEMAGHAVTAALARFIEFLDRSAAGARLQARRVAAVLGVVFVRVLAPVRIDVVPVVDRELLDFADDLQPVERIHLCRALLFR